MKKFAMVFALLALAGCSANQLKPGAEQVRFMQSEPKGCDYRGEVTGNQGNYFTGSWTSNSNLETGARNDLKNQALKMGGNVVVMLTNRAGQTGSGTMDFGVRSEQTNVTMTATVYKCRKLARR